jgi:hypothetical protein
MSKHFRFFLNEVGQHRGSKQALAVKKNQGKNAAVIAGVSVEKKEGRKTDARIGGHADERNGDGGGVCVGGVVLFGHVISVAQVLHHKLLSEHQVERTRTGREGGREKERQKVEAEDKEGGGRGAV